MLMEERRFMDKRMDSMEKDIRELRSEQIKTHEVVTAIREKLNNGMTSAIESNKENIEEIKDSLKIISGWMVKVEPVVNKTPDQRLLDCPLKKEIVDVLKKKINWWLIIGLLILVVGDHIIEIIEYVKLQIGA